MFFNIMLFLSSQGNTVEIQVLKAVSYIGCAVSIVCLLGTIVFFALQGWVHNYAG